MPVKKLTVPALRFLLPLSALLLAACADQPERAEIPPNADFTASILDDGTKLFVFSVPLPRAPGMGGPGGRKMRGEGGPEQAEGQQRARRNAERNHQQALQAMLAQNGYCRQGYVVLEQYEQRDKYIIRGECKDGADERDRIRFKH